MSALMRIGIIRTSRKENERRVPIFPDHLPRFPEWLRSQMTFEEGYGSDYGLPDEYFLKHGAAIGRRDDIFQLCNLIVLPKPMAEDLAQMSSGQILFGWTHCVQQRAIAQAAIDRRLTLISWEAMHHWSQRGERLMHVFYKNNEIAGYVAVLHALQILGVDGHYGPRRRVVVLSYGSVSRGAIYALQGRGFNNIHVFTRRSPHLVADQNPDVYYGQYFVQPDGTVVGRSPEGVERLLIDELAEADIICNGILQDTNNPVMFVPDTHIGRLKPHSLIVDISCDEGMGFSFARATTFSDPVFYVGDHITYYSVDHTPSYLWNAASREISKVLLHCLPIIANGEPEWEADAMIRNAIEIRDGVIQNHNILRFQRRQPDYPHLALQESASAT